VDQYSDGAPWLRKPQKEGAPKSPFLDEVFLLLADADSVRFLDGILDVREDSRQGIEVRGDRAVGDLESQDVDVVVVEVVVEDAPCQGKGKHRRCQWSNDPTKHYKNLHEAR
jgi:hypothetical protein